jgi:hypothetical protein
LSERGPRSRCKVGWNLTVQGSVYEFPFSAELVGQPRATSDLRGAHGRDVPDVPDHVELSL